MFSSKFIIDLFWKHGTYCISLCNWQWFSHRSFSCSNVTLSIGLLSYTFLRRTMKDDIVVPMVCQNCKQDMFEEGYFCLSRSYIFPSLLQLDFKIQDGEVVPLVYGSQGDWDSSLKIILDWSPFCSKEELLQQVRHIHSRYFSPFSSQLLGVADINQAYCCHKNHWSSQSSSIMLSNWEYIHINFRTKTTYNELFYWMIHLGAAPM
jgi:hypothetical protein